MAGWRGSSGEIFRGFYPPSSFFPRLKFPKRSVLWKCSPNRPEAVLAELLLAAAIFSAEKFSDSSVPFARTFPLSLLSDFPLCPTLPGPALAERRRQGFAYRRSETRSASARYIPGLRSPFLPPLSPITRSRRRPDYHPRCFFCSPRRGYHRGRLTDAILRFRSPIGFSLCAGASFARACCREPISKFYDRLLIRRIINCAGPGGRDGITWPESAGLSRDRVKLIYLFSY